MRTLALVLLGLLAGSCQGGSQEELPIAEPELPAVLLDLHLAETAAQSLYGYTRDSVLEVYYDQVCRLHAIQRVDLDTTMARLRRDPERMNRLYDQMLGLIAEREAELRNMD